MSTSLWNYWFFDTAQQEIFICMQLRPRANRWGLTSAEWQIATPPHSFYPPGPWGRHSSNSVWFFSEWVRRLLKYVNMIIAAEKLLFFFGMGEPGLRLRARWVLGDSKEAPTARSSLFNMQGVAYGLMTTN